MKKNLITSAMLFALPVLAMANQLQNNELEMIRIYSAYAAPVAQDQIASSVTVLTEKDFKDRNATYVSDVLKTTPSIAFSASGGRGALMNFYLRGADENHTSVIIDGVKMNPVTGHGVDFGGLSLSNIERIEVLRGEQSALWGSDAMGGVIYITTKSGLYKDKPFNMDFDFGTGSHGAVDGSATFSGYNNGFYYALHGDSHHTRGISAYSSDIFHYTSEKGTSVVTGGATERDKFHRDNAALRFGYADDQKGIELLASHSDQTSHYDTSYADSSYDNLTHTRETVLKLGGYLGSDQNLIKQKASISHIKTYSDSYELGSRSDYATKKLNANYQLDINFDRDGVLKQAVSILAEYQKQDYASNYNSSSGYSVKDKSLIEKSIASEYRLFSDNDNSLSISGRYNQSSEYDNAFTGRIAGAYHLTSNVKVHTSLGTAIKNPTITEYYGYNGSYIPNLALKPEKSKGGDVGLIFESNDKRHSLDVTYFARNVRDAIDVHKINGYYQAYNVDGTSRIRGVEVVYDGKFTEQLTGYANYTLMRAKDSTGAGLPRRPKQVANAGVAYQFTPELSGHTNISYVGKRMDIFYDLNTYVSSRVNMPSYTLVNLGADYNIMPNLTVYADLNNIFNKKYEHTIGYGQDGRNVYVGLKGSF